MTKEQYIRQYIDNGFILFPVTGKDKRLPMGWQKTEYNAFLGVEDFPDNYGVCLQDDDLIIDVDPRNFVEGDKPHQRLAKDIGFDFKCTTIVETGSGGLHMYLKKPTNCKVRRKHPDYRGIDFLSKGAFVIGAGSQNLITKKFYKIVKGEIGKSAPVPSPLLDKLQVTDQDFAKMNVIDGFIDDEQTVLRFKHWLIRAEVAVSGDNGNHITFRAACQGRRFGLSPVKTLEQMEIWNEKCEPPWHPDELKIIVHNAYEYNSEPVGAGSPHADFSPIEKMDEEKEIEVKIHWQRAKGGGLLPSSIHNVCNFFLCNPASEELHNLLMYNLFTKNIEFSRKPVWLDPRDVLTPWDETDAIMCKKLFSSAYAYNLQKNLIHEAALAVANVTSYHPIKDYLNSLKWDGVKRVRDWMPTYLGTKDTEYEQAVGELLLIAAVARIFSPGCKYEYLVILEGEQGVGKTRACAILGGEWYGDIVIDVHNKDTVDAMRLKWIIEVSEMEMARRTDVQAMKTFLSKSVDTVRLAYARGAKDFPRQQVFIGTINPESDGYLKDMTGNRRFFPVTVKQIDQKKLIADRDQLWAEAVVLYEALPKNRDLELFLTDPKVYQMAADEADRRRFRDPWMDTVKQWLDDPDTERNFVMSKDIYHFAIGGEAKDFDKIKSTRIANVLKDLGWGKTITKRVNGATCRGYIRPEELKPKLENL